MYLSAAIKNKEIILLDGAMGAQLDRRGLMSRGRNNLDAPEVVVVRRLRTFAQLLAC